MEVEIEIKGKKLILETGIFAKQTNGSVLVKYGDTYVLCTVVTEKIPKKGWILSRLQLIIRKKLTLQAKFQEAFLKERVSQQTEKFLFPV